jgi:hypothetical protein
MLEIFIIVAVVFFIAVLFYKQANEDFEILQITSARMDELPTLYAERYPIVLSDYALPGLGTESELRKRPAILQMKMGGTTFSGKFTCLELQPCNSKPSAMRYVLKPQYLIWMSI